MAGFTVKLNDLVGAVETFELSLKLASLVGDEQAQDAIKKALKDVNSKIVEGLKADDSPDNDEVNQGDSNEQPQATEADGEKQEATEDDGEKKETTEDDDKPTENTEEEQLNA